MVMEGARKRASKQQTTEPELYNYTPAIPLGEDNPVTVTGSDPRGGRLVEPQLADILAPEQPLGEARGDLESLHAAEELLNRLEQQTAQQATDAQMPVDEWKVLAKQFPEIAAKVMTAAGEQQRKSHFQGQPGEGFETVHANDMARAGDSESSAVRWANKTLPEKMQRKFTIMADPPAADGKRYGTSIIQKVNALAKFKQGFGFDLEEVVPLSTPYRCTIIRTNGVRCSYHAETPEKVAEHEQIRHWEQYGFRSAAEQRAREQRALEAQERNNQMMAAILERLSNQQAVAPQNEQLAAAIAQLASALAEQKGA